MEDFHLKAVVHGGVKGRDVLSVVSEILVIMKIVSS